MSLPNAATLTATVYDCVMALAQRCADWLGLATPDEPAPLSRVALWVPDGQFYVLTEPRLAAAGNRQWWPVLLERPPPPPAILRPSESESDRASVRSLIEPLSENLRAVAALQAEERDAMLARMRAVFQ